MASLSLVASEAEETRSLFDGKTLEAFEDFEFRCLFRLTGNPSTGMINSGIQLHKGGKAKIQFSDITITELK